MNLLNATATVICVASTMTEALENGVGRTPPMGWSSWNNFHININEQMIRQQADAMVSSGMKDVGYTYINTDDGWCNGRTSAGELVSKPTTFPSGMKALADYIHSKGLKAGIYTDAGTNTCSRIYDGDPAGLWGSYGYYEQDMKTFLLDWGYDYIKVDWCGGQELGLDLQTAYAQIRDAILKTGTPVYYSVCCWHFPGDWVVDVGNSWRTTGDIGASYESIMSIADAQPVHRTYHGPGHWNDADMLQVGRGMSAAEDRTHFSLWCILASPLLAGNDLRSMSAATISILTNSEAIAVNQDSLGIMGNKVLVQGNLNYWVKPMKDSSFAVAMVNRGTSDVQMTANWSQLGIPGKEYRIRDLWAHEDKGASSTGYTAIVGSHDVSMIRLFPGPDLTPAHVTAAYARSETSVAVRFSESVEEASAETSTNYAITNGISIYSASLGTDLKTVNLTVSTMTKGSSYVLTAKDIRDRAETPNVMAAPQTLPFTYYEGLTRIRYYPRSSFASRMNGGVFEGTNGSPSDGPYTVIHTISSAPPESQWSEVNLDPAAGFRYVRYLSPDAGYGNVAEIEFYRGTEKVSGPMFGAAGSWQNSGNDYTRAFDGNASTFFDCSQADGAYCGMELGSSGTTLLGAAYRSADASTSSIYVSNTQVPRIVVSLPQADHNVSISIHDIRGRCMRVMIISSGGQTTVPIDARTGNGLALAPGRYVVHAAAKTWSMSKAVHVVR